MRQSIVDDCRGAAFVLFAMVMPIILTGALFLLGLSGFAAARADLQVASHAATNAVLADLNAALQISATPDAIVTDFDKKTRAQTIVNSLLQSRHDLKNITTEVSTTSTTLSVTITADIASITGDIYWLPYISSTATSTVSWSRASQMQIVIAVDGGTTLSKPGVAKRLAAIKPAIVQTVNEFSSLPQYPDVAMSVVPFAAQVAIDPAIISATTMSTSGTFYAALLQRFAQASDAISNSFITRAEAAAKACYNDPIIPPGVDGTAFGGTSKPVKKPCVSSALQEIRQIGKISRPKVNGVAPAEDPTSPEKRHRDNIISTIRALSPVGCRNLALGVAWSLAQLPVDSNPKVIFLIVNGNSTQNSKGRTDECASGSSVKAPQAALDREFLAACDVARDPEKNASRRVDLVILQLVDGNETLLRSCAGNNDNYFNAMNDAAISNVFKSARTRLLEVAAEQNDLEADEGRLWQQD